MLQNRNTGEKGILNYYDGCFQVLEPDIPLCGNSAIAEYNTLAGLCENWKDYQEPTKCYYLDYLYRVQYMSLVNCGDSQKNRDHLERLKEIGNYFNSYEEAKEASERIKSLNKLVELNRKYDAYIDFKLYCEDESARTEIKNALELLLAKVGVGYED